MQMHVKEGSIAFYYRSLVHRPPRWVVAPAAGEQAAYGTQVAAT